MRHFSLRQVFLTNGDEKKEGNFVLSFPEKGFIQEECGEIAKKVMHLLEAKGFGKNRRWQASSPILKLIEISILNSNLKSS